MPNQNNKCRNHANTQANVNMKTTGGDTALHWACSAEEAVGGDGSVDAGNIQERSLKVTEMLLAAGADIRAKNERELKPLDSAAGEGVRALLMSALQAFDQREEEEASKQKVACFRLLFQLEVYTCWR